MPAYICNTALRAPEDLSIGDTFNYTVRSPVWILFGPNPHILNFDNDPSAQLSWDQLQFKREKINTHTEVVWIKCFSIHLKMNLFFLKFANLTFIDPDQLWSISCTILGRHLVASNETTKPNQAQKGNLHIWNSPHFFYPPLVLWACEFRLHHLLCL